MLVDLAFGTTGLEVEVPDDAVVVAPKHRPAARDPLGEIRRSLREPVAGPPLAALARPGQKVAIAVCDVTRPQPRDLVVPAILDELDGIVDPADVVVIVATGTHRGSTQSERLAMFGREVLDRVRVLDHDCRDSSSLVDFGTLGSGVPVRLAKAFVQADLRITTGFVEPHFFAGFSGGPKLLAPGLAGLETVLTLHDASRIGDPRATFGVLEGNPVHDDVRAISAAVGVHFACDVVLDAAQEVVEAFSGELFAMHRAACELVRAASMQAVSDRFDVVVTTNAGWPLDQDLYQAVKGISAASEVVRDGGLVVAAAECREGFPSHGSLQGLLSAAPSARAFLDSLPDGPATPDQWQAQVLARSLERSRVAMRTDGLTAGELASVHLGAVADVHQAVAAELARRGPGATCCVLPEGPRTIPYLVGV
ncbi:MAG: hypothetical protein JWM85_1313 [Acidimicrobiaceae bacterium]|nr:hypothetical protein [Acidimicrobiaceae bacterium]